PFDLPPFLVFPWCVDDDVHGPVAALENRGNLDTTFHRSLRGLHNHAEIQVAVTPRVAPGLAAKQDDALRMKMLDDGARYMVDDARVNQRRVLCYRLTHRLGTSLSSG